MTPKDPTTKFYRDIRLAASIEDRSERDAAAKALARSCGLPSNYVRGEVNRLHRAGKGVQHDAP